MYHVCTTAKKVPNFVLHLHIFYRRILLCELHVLHEPHLYDWNTTAIVFFVFLSCFLCFLRLSFSLLNILKKPFCFHVVVHLRVTQHPTSFVTVLLFSLIATLRMHQCFFPLARCFFNDGQNCNSAILTLTTWNWVGYIFVDPLQNFIFSSLLLCLLLHPHPPPQPLPPTYGRERFFDCATKSMSSSSSSSSASSSLL